MKRNLTTLTKIVVYLMTLAVISVTAIFLPELAREEASGKANPPLTYPFFIAAWTLSVPIFIALYQTLKLINYIDQNKAFSNRSVKALKIIKYCSVVFSILIIIGTTAMLVFVRTMDPSEDSPPIAMFGSILVFVSSLITTFVAILQRLLQDAIRIKSQNDSIV